MRRISIVIPVFNESHAIGATLQSLEQALGQLQYSWEVVIVNDGSTDDTVHQVKSFASLSMDLVVVDLSRNFGKEAALSAGLEYATGEAVIPMDADLQDPPSLVGEMLKLWEAGAEVVVARRSDRSADSFLKRNSSAWFYRIANRVSDVSIPENVGDFRVMDRAVVDVIRQLPESCRFMKGLFAWAGFRVAVVEYARPARASGSSKFNAFRLINLAIEGITSFSIVPLRIASYLGAAVALTSFLYGVGIIVYTLAFGRNVPGYPSLITVVLFLSGIQLLSLGIIGEYVGRTYVESKRRPPFVVRSVWRGR